ncbi:secretin N-terminal domain-containing protein, partial [Paraburkholderia sp. BR14374]
STGSSGTPPLPSGGLGGGSMNSPMGGGASGSSSNTGGFLGGDKEKSEDQGGGMITADSATNSLIITAPEATYRNLRAVIDQLDARRAQ